MLVFWLPVVMDAGPVVRGVLQEITEFLFRTPGTFNIRLL